MELNLEQKQQLEKLLAKPALATQEHIPFLQDLVDTYPYYQPLYLLLAKASNGGEGQHQAFTKAALYNNGSILHRIIHEPQHLNDIDEPNIVIYQEWETIAEVEPETELAEINNEHPVETQEKHVIENAPEIENLAPLANEIIPLDNNEIKEIPEEEEVADVESISIEEKQPEKEEVKQQIFAPEIENLEPLYDEIIKVCEPKPEIEEDHFTAEADEQDTFEEISEVPTPTDFIHTEPEVEIPQIETIEEEVVENAEEESTIESTENLQDVVEIETFASASFFAFDRNFSSEKIEEEEQDEQTAAEEPIPNIVETIDFQVKDNTVSKYDDDKLPFTFLWWLAKTRKNHEQIFRPFVSPIKANTPAQDLQQQYVENIFHIQAPFETDQEEQNKQEEKISKESEIIDSFIKNDPQIKVLPPNQINNENKAKKSAEDSNDLVSETLAQIYIEQTLYHKAIDTYQKLSLKFPEKSRYFADLIQSLEKKI